MKNSVVPTIIIGVLFFIFGFVTWLNGSLIPFLKLLCDLNEFEALFVAFAFYIAYTVMAWPMSYLLERSGYKNGMMIGLGVMALGALLFIPAAQTASFIFFLVALFTLGTGLTILQSASNPYIVHMGDIKSAAMRISIMGLINKSAGVLAPIVFAVFVFEDTPLTQTLSSDAKNLLASKLTMPYITMASILTALIALVKFSPLPEIEFEDDESEKGSIFTYPQVVLGAIALFFYVGIEVIAGDTIGLYGQSMGITNFATLTSYTMVFMVFGYLAGVLFIPRYISQEKALLLSALLGSLFLVGAATASTTNESVSQALWGFTSIATLPNSITFVALLGFANALVWPTIWPLALNGLGSLSAKASALLIMSIAGGAILPLAFGKIAQLSQNMQSTYLMGLVCYGFIFAYALWWHKKKSWR